MEVLKKKSLLSKIAFYIMVFVLNMSFQARAKTYKVNRRFNPARLIVK